MRNKRKILAGGVAILFLCVVMAMTIFKGELDLDVAKLESPNGKFMAYHRIAHDEGGIAPYSDYVLVRSSGFKFTSGNIKAAKFVGYCSREKGKVTMRWVDSSHLIVNCDVLACGIVKAENAIELGVRISYNFGNYDPIKQHLDADGCNP